MVSDKGTYGLLPKYEGIGIMVSAVQCREFGFVHGELTDDELKKINDWRRNKNYLDGDSARTVNGTTLKPNLVSDPVYIYFEYGANRQGYWKYDHFALQYEEIIDCLEVSYP